MSYMSEPRLAEDPNVLRRKLGIELRKHRESLHFKQQEAADQLDWSLSKLIRIEKGAHAVSVGDLRSVIDVYKITDEVEIATLLATARRARGQSWWSRYRDVVSPQFARYLGHEGMADTFRVFHPYLIPGLLQTEEYATELLKVLEDQKAAQLLVDLKMARQELLFSQPGLSFTFIMGEEALHRLVGGPRVMQRQRERLADLGSRSNVALRVVPYSAGAYPGLLGPFVMLALMESGEDVLFQESVGGDQLVRDDPETMARYAEYFEAMADQCLPLDQIPLSS